MARDDRPRIVIVLDDPPPPEPKQHTCGVCRTVGLWDDEWRWYGSYRDVDERPEGVFTVCSTSCRRRSEQEPWKYGLQITPTKRRA